MATPLYSALRAELEGLAQTTWRARQAELDSHADAGPLGPLEPAQLKEQVQAAWARAGGSDDEGSSSSRTADVVRSTLDMVGRDIAVRPVMNGELREPDADAPDVEKARFQTALQDRLDIVLTLFELVYERMTVPSLEPGAVFIPLLEDFVEILLVSTWRDLFSYVESRAPRFCKDMPASKGKALPLLRTINSFLRFLSHTPDDLSLRGRVQLFASRAISVADKSAVNLRGEYAPVVTTWEDEPVEVEADGDVKMNDEDKEELKKKAEPDFYVSLWTLQKFFAHPPSLEGPPAGDPAQTPFESFRTKSDFVLSRLYEQTRRERVLQGKNPSRGVKRPRQEIAYPQYLTARSLLQYELSDSQFRRQVLVQFFILFQFLLNLTPATAGKQQFTGGMPKTFVVEGDAKRWVEDTARNIRRELRDMGADGPAFERTVIELMNRERRYAKWKNDGCPESEWELPPADTADAAAAATKWKRHCAPMRNWPHKLGTPALSAAWADPLPDLSDADNVISLFGGPVKHRTVYELEAALSAAEEEAEDDRAMGREPDPSVLEKIKTLKWKGLREARLSHPRFVSKQGMAYDLHKLVAMLNEATSRKLAARDRAATGENADEDAEAEAEAEANAEAEGEPDADESAEQPEQSEQLDKAPEERENGEAVNGSAEAIASPPAPSASASPVKAASPAQSPAESPAKELANGNSNGLSTPEGDVEMAPAEALTPEE